jgi:hypothetical protein
MSDHSKVRFCPAGQPIHNRLGLAKTQLQQLLTETAISLNTRAWLACKEKGSKTEGTRFAALAAIY